jgi:hypothetical protein
MQKNVDPCLRDGVPSEEILITVHYKLRGEP